jgi:hypothetical protein
MNLHRLHQAPHWSCLGSARLLWLALLIALFAALAPTLSLVMSSDGSSVPSLMDICSSDPAHRLDGAQPQGPDQNTPAGLLKHCPLCLHGMDRLAVLLTAAFELAVREDDSLALPTGLILPIVLRYLSTPPPRGPPVSS